MSLLDAEPDPYAEIAHIGDLQLPKVGRIVRVRLMPDPEHGPGVDVREFILPSYWDRINAARARAVTSGRKLNTAGTANQYVGPTKRGFRLSPFAADELAELLQLAALKADAM